MPPAALLADPAEDARDGAGDTAEREERTEDALLPQRRAPDATDVAVEDATETEASSTPLGRSLPLGPAAHVAALTAEWPDTAEHLAVMSTPQAALPSGCMAASSIGVGAAAAACQVPRRPSRPKSAAAGGSGGSGVSGLRHKRRWTAFKLYTQELISSILHRQDSAAPV